MKFLFKLELNKIIDFPPDFTLRKHHQLSFLSVLNKNKTDNKIPCYFNLSCGIKVEIMSKIARRRRNIKKLTKWLKM